MQINSYFFTSTYTRLPHPPSNNGRMAGHTAPTGENSFRYDNAMDIFGTCFRTDQNNLFPCTSPVCSGIRIKNNLPCGGAWGCGKTLCYYIKLRLRIDGAMKQLIQMFNFNSFKRFFLCYNSLLHEVYR